MKKSGKKEKVDVRKYVNYVLMMVAVVLVAFIAVKLYNTYEDNKLGESVFTKMARNIQYDDIDSTTSEMSTDSFILISYTKNKEVKDFEEALKRSVINNELQDKFYYLDATDAMLNENYISSLNRKFALDEHHAIEELPAILYYKEGKFMTSISSTSSRMLTSDDFEKLLDSYEIKPIN